MQTPSDISCVMLSNCDVISQIASRLAPIDEIALLRAALRMSFEAARLLRIINGMYREPLRPLQKSLASLSLIHADMGSVVDDAADEARERLRSRIAHLQDYIDRLSELGVSFGNRWCPNFV